MSHDGILTALGISERFDIIYSFVEKRIPILLLGPAGSGKSYLGMNLMKKFSKERFSGTEVIRLGELDDDSLRSKDIKALYIAGSANVTRLDVLGGRTLDEGSYVRRPGILQKMIETGGVVFLDELSSLPPQFNILLNEIIDRIINRETHPDFYMFFAGNPGTYLGANDLPDATAERLVTLYFGYYPFADEVHIVKEMIRNGASLQSDFIAPQEGFDAFVRFSVGLVRKMRNTAVGEEEIPLSVRSIFMLVTTALTLASLHPKNPTSSSLGSPERIGIYKTLEDRMPGTMTEGMESISVEILIQYMADHGVNWNVMRHAIDSLGSIQRIRGSSVYEAFTSVVPR